MSEPGRPAGGGGSEAVAASALRDPNVTQLLHVCGEHIDLVLNPALLSMCDSNTATIPGAICIQMKEQEWNNTSLWYRPLERALQSRYADCRCSPFGRLVMRSAVVSGSPAEGLSTPPRPRKYQTTSDVDHITLQLQFTGPVGPVHWTFPGSEETSPVEDTAAGLATATAAEPRGQDSDPTPQLVIAETDNHGFVLVLQERRDDCPHQERRPFKAEAVTQYLSDYLLVTAGKGMVEVSSDESAYDEVPCLHVPVWWFSDEFFTRHRIYNWPPEAVRDNIRQYGLHLVPVGAPGSSTEQLEFRLSFSRAEVVIASHLTEVQRCAATAFKMCKTALGEEGKLLKSYFVKTALLWLCEQTPTEDWTSVSQGVLKLVDFLDTAVSTGNLPCYFWSRINLLRFATRDDRKTMQKALGNIRQHLMRLLAHDVCMFCPDLQKMLTLESGQQLSERQLRVCLTRWLIRGGVVNSMARHMAMLTKDPLKQVLSVLPLSPEDVMTVFHSWRHWYYVQKALYQALIVAPADVASHVRFSASGGGGFVWDAAPLLELITEDDLKELLGDPDAVRAWLRRQHQLPETEQPTGLPADLRSPRDLCDLLLSIPLLMSVLWKSVTVKFDKYRMAGLQMASLTITDVDSVEDARQAALQFAALWPKFAYILQTVLGMDRQTALQMASRFGTEIRQLCDDPETLAEHGHSLPDSWQLRH